MIRPSELFECQVKTEEPTANRRQLYNLNSYQAYTTKRLLIFHHPNQPIATMALETN